jgi:glycosyltransferase involved in cell wall biosynthesis
MKPLVSILIPAYNAERWIGDTIRSALAQTWKRIEIIVVNDGSSDKTAEFARQAGGANATVVTQPNSGAAAARNNALTLCRGDYIQWLDADDLLAPDKIEKQLAATAGCSRRTLLSSPWAYFMYRPRKAQFAPTALWSDLSPVEWLVRKLDLNLHMQTATWLVSRELTDAAGAWDTRLLGDDDGEYFCRVLLASEGVRFIPQTGVFYRRTAGSLSFIGLSNRKIEAQWVSMKLHIRYLRSLEDSPRVRDACIKYLQRYLLYFYPERPDLVSQAQEMAASLGGRLENPKLSWKYSWIQKLFGWELGKRAWLCLPWFREALARNWDKALFRLEGRNPEAGDLTVVCSELG